MGSGPYLVVLFVGAIIVVVDGQLIVRNSPAYLAEVYRARPARKLSLLVAVFFHLVMLGVVALVASVGLGAAPGVQSIMARIGVILLLTAAGHALTLKILSRLRQEQEGTELAEAQIATQRGATQYGTGSHDGPAPRDGGAAQRPDTRSTHSQPPGPGDPR